MAFSTTVDALVERVRRDALLASRGAVHTLDSAITANADTLTLAEVPSHIGPGSVLSIDYELFYVKTCSPGTKICTLIPGYYGSTTASHDAGALVEVDARFPKAALMDYAEQEIRSWGTKLWQVTSVDLDVDRMGRTYELVTPEEIIYLLDVRVKPTGETSNFWNFSWTGDAWPHADARLLREMSTAEFPSGTAIQFLRPPGRGTTARVAFAQKLDLSAFDATTDLVADVGCKPEWLDIVELGARYRALSSTITGRADWRTGNMARAAEEVSTFDVMRAAQLAQQMRDARFVEEVTNLRAAWPYRT